MSRKSPHKIQLLLDSGVFSSWNLKKPLSLADYIEYLKRNEDWIWRYVNFDKIPGEYGKKRTQEQLDDSAKQSYTNLQRMLDAGLTPMPVYHQGEHLKWLERLLKDGHDYIGISTAKDLRPRAQMSWLNDVYSLLCDAKGRPLVKTHGFGITKPKWLLGYPFYTTDSTTWALSAGYGIVYVPRQDPKTGNDDYSQPPSRVILSGVQQKSYSQNKRQFENLGPNVQKHVRRFIEHTVGLTLTEARYDPSARRMAILVYFRELTKHLGRVRFKQHNHRSSTAAQRATLLQTRKAGRWPLTIMYATHMQPIFTDLLCKAGATTQLLSYFELKGKSDEALRQYVETGVIERKPKRTKRRGWDDPNYVTFRALELNKRVKEADDEAQRLGQTIEGASASPGN